MITINHPYIEHQEKESFLYSRVIDETRNRDSLVWFSVKHEYGSYLCDETADAFVLMMLQLAMQSGQDLKVDAPVSSRLLFNIENTFQPMFSRALPGFQHIKVMATSTVEHNYQGSAVGCGCSLGVDSFYSFLKHTSSDVPDSYKVTHLALFNCGQLGDIDLKGAEDNYHETIADLEPFLEETNLPLVTVNSNLNELYLDSGVRLLQSSVNRTICCVLALQKLFAKYLYASCYTIDHFMVSPRDESYMESALVPLMSTESTEVILSPTTMSRVNKTAYISHHPITYKYLDVCWAKQMKYCSSKNPVLADTKTKKNCGMCGKCLRTLLTFDILGVIDKYKDIFDLDEYYKRKKEFICTVARKCGYDVYSEELVGLIKRTKYPIPFKAKVLCYDGLGWKILRWGRRCALDMKSKIMGKKKPE